MFRANGQVMKTIIVFGATSAISQAYINRVAKGCEQIILLARDSEQLAQIASHTEVISQANVRSIVCDLADTNQHAKVIDEVFNGVEQVGCALISYGVLTDQERCNTDVDYLLEQFNLNGTSTISLSARIGRELATRGAGTLAVIGSVAGDRGRQSNYCYGSAKASVESFLSGQRGFLSKSGVNVLTIKPGFVDTPMTSEFKKGLLWASPDKVAADIDTAVQKGRSVLYTPWFWRFIMLIIKSIPEFIFRRLPL